jgi:DNA-binding SARP family transcriptional activator
MTLRTAPDLIQIRLITLGRMAAIARDGSHIEELERAPKLFALLVYCLVEHGNDWVGVERLHDLFWTDATTRRAANALNQLAHRHRRTVGKLLERTPTAARVSVSIWCDAAELLRGHTGAQWVAAHYHGEFAPGLQGPRGAPEFATWIDSTRARLRTRALDLLLGACDTASPADTVRYARMALQVDPYSPPAALHLLRAMAIQSPGSPELRRERDLFFHRYARELGYDPPADLKLNFERLCSAPRSNEPAAGSEEDSWNQEASHGADCGAAMPARPRGKPVSDPTPMSEGLEWVPDHASAVQPESGRMWRHAAIGAVLIILTAGALLLRPGPPWTPGGDAGTPPSASPDSVAPAGLPLRERIMSNDASIP